MELEKIKAFVVDSYCSLKINYADGMDTSASYGKFREKCAEAKTLYKIATELGVDDLVDPPEIDDEWDFWSGVEGIQFKSGDDHYTEDEEIDDGYIEELGDLPDEDLEEDDDY